MTKKSHVGKIFCVRKRTGKAIALLAFCGFFFFKAPLALAQYTGGGYDGGSAATSETEVAGVNTNSPDHLTFTGTIPDSYAAAAFSPQPVVKLMDKNENIIDNDTDIVTLSLYNNTGATSLTGTRTETLSNGVADFSGNALVLSAPGELYMLKATVTTSTVPAKTVEGFSNSFRIFSLTVKSDAFYDKSANGYYVIAWLEADGVRVELGAGDTCTATIIDANGDSGGAGTFAVDQGN